MQKDQDNLKLIMLRLSTKADSLVREHVRKRGDLSRLVMEAIYGVNIDKIHAERRWLRCGRYQEKGNYKYTSVTIPSEIYKKLAKSAKGKKTSISALIDAIIVDFYSEGTMVQTTEDEDCFV